MFFSLAAVEVGTHLYWEHCRFNSARTSIISYMACNCHYLSNYCSWYTKLQQVPKGLQNFVEAVFEYVSGIAKDQLR